jgi:LVIVD repeat
MRFGIMLLFLSLFLVACEEEADPADFVRKAQLEVSSTGPMVLNLPYLYISHEAKLEIIKVSENADSLEVVGEIDVPLLRIGPMVLGDGVLYIAMREQMLVYDLTDPGNPTLALTFELHDLYEGWVDGMEKIGNRLYAGVRARGMFIIDISDPLAPKVEGRAEDVPIRHFAISGTKFFGVDRDRYSVYPDMPLDVFSFDDPLVPTKLGTVDGGGALFHDGRRPSRFGGQQPTTFRYQRRSPGRGCQPTRHECKPGHHGRCDLLWRRSGY